MKNNRLLLDIKPKHCKFIFSLNNILVLKQYIKLVYKIIKLNDIIKNMICGL